AGLRPGRHRLGAHAQLRADMNRLKDKVAFITGAGNGIGREATLLFASEGARVIVADLDDKAAKETVRLVGAGGGQAVAATGDVAVEADLARMIEEGGRRFGGLHGLYNNAALLLKDRHPPVPPPSPPLSDP